MTAYIFFTNNTQSFIPTQDKLSFSYSISAADVYFSSDGYNTTFTTSAGSMTLTGMVQKNITSTNVIFDNGSLLLVGDNTSGINADDNGQTLSGGSGNDRIYGMNGSDIILGNGGNDIIFGGSAITDAADSADDMNGGRGADIIYANGGNDTITGLDGMDIVYAGVGNDSVIYSSDEDRILVYGNDGTDTILSGTGDDTIYGGSAVLNSNDSADSINAGIGSDIIYGNGGNDTITGTTGSDSIYAGFGNDTINYSGSTTGMLAYGNQGNDTISGSSGADTIYGGGRETNTDDGADNITGNAGADVIYGNGSSDTITGTAAGGNDTVYGGVDIDIINYSAETTSTAKIVICGNENGDIITGSSGNDTIYGGISATDTNDGSDSITVGIGADLVYANVGDDTVTGAGLGTDSSTIYGGMGNDTINWAAVTGFGGILYGGDGADNISGAAVANTIDGGAGNDSITSGTEVADSMIGGTGSDIFMFNLAGDLASSDTITGGDGASDTSSDTDTLKFGSNEVAITAEILAHVTGIEAISLLSDADDNEVTLTDAFVSSASGGIVTISLRFVGEGNNDFTLYAAAVIDSSNRLMVTSGDGNDSMTGGAGSDTLSGGNGADIFYETVSSGIGSDLINGGDDDDSIIITSANFTSALTIAGDSGSDTILFTDRATVVDADFTNITSIEQLSFSTNGNTLVLGSYANTMMGVAGVLYVGNSNHTIISLDTSAISSDRDVTIATTGVVTLSNNSNRVSVISGRSASIIGGSGADTIIGNDGADSISGGGNTSTAGDSLTGGTGSDVFYFNTASDMANSMNGTETTISKIDTITDFTTTADKITLSSDIGAFVAGETLMNGLTTIQREAHTIDGTNINNFNDLLTLFEDTAAGTASTSINLYIYEYTVTTGGNFNGTHIIIINNGTASIGLDDAFIILSGTSSAALVASDFNFTIDDIT